MSDNWHTPPCPICGGDTDDASIWSDGVHMQCGHIIPYMVWDTVAERTEWHLTKPEPRPGCIYPTVDKDPT